MKVSKDLLKKLEKLYSQYEEEIPKEEKNRILKENPKGIYLLHNNDFMKWLKHDFESEKKTNMKLEENDEYSKCKTIF